MTDISINSPDDKFWVKFVVITGGSPSDSQFRIINDKVSSQLDSVLGVSETDIYCKITSDRSTFSQIECLINLEHVISLSTLQSIRDAIDAGLEGDTSLASLNPEVDEIQHVSESVAMRDVPDAVRSFEGAVQ